LISGETRGVPAIADALNATGPIATAVGPGTFLVHQGLEFANNPEGRALPGAIKNWIGHAVPDHFGISSAEAAEPSPSLGERLKTVKDTAGVLVGASKAGAKDVIDPGSSTFETLKTRQQQELDAFDAEHPLFKVPQGLKEGAADQRVLDIQRQLNGMGYKVPTDGKLSKESPTMRAIGDARWIVRKASSRRCRSA
jgi:hypothetical protein